jgi:hypothetical protein
MGDVMVYYPARKQGVIFHLVSMSALVAGGVLGMSQATRSPAGLVFMLNLLVALVSVGLLLVLAYRLYALWTASYSLERDGIRIRWGFRSEDLPINAVLWMRPAEDLAMHLPLPLIRWPGAVTGVRRIPGGEGRRAVIEYMADRVSSLILIATAERILAISPADGNAFLAAYQQFSEKGSLTPFAAHSIYPGFLFPEVWEDAAARFLVLGSIMLVLILFAWVSILIPQRQQISLRISPADTAMDYVPAVQLLLLPVMNTVFFLADVSLGLFFYRRPEIRSLAYLLWSSSIAVSLLFIGAVVFIAQAA